MKGFRWRSVMPDDDTQRATSTEDSAAADYSPARSAKSYRPSTNSSIRGMRGSSRAPKSLEGSPSTSWRGSGTADGGVGVTVAEPSGSGSEDGTGVTMSNKKMLKIGANVRFRGDVMECNTVLLCGRLQGFVETQCLTVKEGGKFVGDAKVEDADVYGSVEGTLESTSKICVRSTGNVTGTVVYRTMLMEEGGEVEGTFKCSNKSSRKAGNETGRELHEADAAAVTVAVTSGTGDGSPSPKWRQRKEDDAARSGTTGASAIGEAEPEKAAQALPATPAAAATVAALAPAMGSSGGGLPKTSPASVVWPPSAASAATGVSSPGQDSLRGAKYLGSVKRGAPRRGLSLPAGSPSRVARVSAPSPKRPAGLQGAEASEVFSAEEELSPESTTPVFASHAASEVAGKKSSPSSSAEVAAEVNAVPPPVVLEGGTSVAARVGTWPPASPAHSKSWNRQAENITPASASNPVTASAAAGSPPTASPAKITPKSGIRKTFVDSNKPPPATPGSGQRQNKNQNQNQSPLPTSVGEGLSRMFVEARGVFGIVGGIAAAANGKGQTGGGSGKVDKAEPNVVSAAAAALPRKTPESGRGEGGAVKAKAVTSDRIEEKEVSLVMKACEAPGCFMEACWGDPRFRPRYCARHKKQGSKLMDPVEVEEGDEAALPEGSPPPSERAPSMDAVTGVDKGVGDTAASAVVGKLNYEPFRKISVFGAPSISTSSAERGDAANKNARHGGSNSSGDGHTGVGGGTRSRDQKQGELKGNDGDDDDEDLEDDEDEDEGWGNGGSDPSLVVNGALGGGSFVVNAGGVGLGMESGSGSGKNDSTKTLPSKQQEEQRKQTEEQQQENDSTKTPTSKQQQKQPEQQQQEQEKQQQHEEQQQQHEEQQQKQQQHEEQQQKQQQQEEEEQQHEKQQEEQRIDNAQGSVEVTPDEVEMADVQARVEMYARLTANKSQPPPSKAKPSKSKKRSPGTNIADFYGRGDDSGSGDETSYSMDVYNKGVLQSQAAEVGTHTEDGQLRPQPSQERDQQKLAHLMKVGKLGAAFRGRGVSAAAKRR